MKLKRSTGKTLHFKK